MSESKKFIQALERRVKFIDHLVSHNEFVTNFTEGYIIVKRGQGRPNNNKGSSFGQDRVVAIRRYSFRI